jgi:tetratricopeptide (TPR) repeat protein
MTRFAIPALALLLILVALPCLAAEGSEAMNSAGALYSQSVDLANEGKYQQALAAADKALAMNVTSLTGLIQSNRAGILVMLNRNEEAVTAADAALAVEGNLTTVHSIAWYNKGNALRNLGRIAEARDAYDHAYALDNTLVPPNLGPVTESSAATPVSSIPMTGTPAPAATAPAPAPTKSPVLPVLPAVSLALAGCIMVIRRQR